MQNQIIHLPNEFKKEFSIDREGKTFCSRRGLSRLSGVRDTTIYHPTKDTGLLKNILLSKSLSKPLEPFAFNDFRVLSFLPDILCTAIIQHYAFKGKKDAQAFLIAFAAIGFRSWVQSQLNWKKCQPTPEQEEERLILKCVHRSLTDATKAYSDRHKEMSDRRRNNLHNNTAQRISICRPRFISHQAKERTRSQDFSRCTNSRAIAPTSATRTSRSDVN